MTLIIAYYQEDWSYDPPIIEFFHKTNDFVSKKECERFIKNKISIYKKHKEDFAEKVRAYDRSIEQYETSSDVRNIKVKITQIVTAIKEINASIAFGTSTKRKQDILQELRKQQRSFELQLDTIKNSIIIPYPTSDIPKENTLFNDYRFPLYGISNDEGCIVVYTVDEFIEYMTTRNS